MLNKILASTLTCCIVLPLTSSCVAESRSTETRPSAQKGPSYWEPSYWREYYIDWHHGFQEGLGEVEVNGKWGFINSAGRIAIKPKFNEVTPFSEGIAMARSGAIITDMDGAFLGLYGTWSYIDKKGRIVHKMEGDGFSEGLAAVCVTGKLTTILTGGAKFGFIDRKGKMAMAQKYSRVKSFSEGLASFEDPNRKWGYINAKGEVVIKPQYLWAYGFSEGLAKASVDGKNSGYINTRGKFVIKPEYNWATAFSEGFAAVKREEKGKWGYIDQRGKQLTKFKFDHAQPFAEGYAAIVVGGKLGYIATSGKYVIEPQFRYVAHWEPVSSFSEGLAAVMVGDKWGYIDKAGTLTIEPKFNQAGKFTEGFAKVAVGDKLGYIDKQGNYIWEPTR